MTTKLPPLSRYLLDKDSFSAHLEGEPRYRVDQVWDGLYQRFEDFGEMTSVSKALRGQLSESLPYALEEAARSTTPNGDTVKWLWQLHGGATVETVLMHYNKRSTVCVSSQAGCAMACDFCATGQAGFERQLNVGEIVEQVVRSIREAHPRRVSNVVFMGMGEPMANYDATWGAVERIHGDIGISARHITISTVGIVPGIRRLAAEALPVNLAVSLHAANDELRNEMVPINKRYPIADLADACADYLRIKNRRLSFEWAMIDNVNDRPIDAEQLAKLCRRLRAHVNLIPLNPTPGYAVKGTPISRVNEFRDHLESMGVNATVRKNRGTDIDAACGQLRANHEVAVAAPTRANTIDS